MPVEPRGRRMTDPADAVSERLVLFIRSVRVTQHTRATVASLEQGLGTWVITPKAGVAPAMWIFDDGGSLRVDIGPTRCLRLRRTADSVAVIENVFSALLSGR